MTDSTQALRNAIESFIARREPTPAGFGRAARGQPAWPGDPETVTAAAAMFPPLRRHVRPLRPERAGRLWLARLRALMAVPKTSEDRDEAARLHELTADAGPVPAPEEQAAVAP